MGDADAQDELKRLYAQAATRPRQARESGWGTNRRIGKIYAAPPGEDPEPLLAKALDETGTTGIMHPDLAAALAYGYGDGHLPVMTARIVDLDARRGMRDFILGAQYASRGTFPTLRLIAGQMSPKGDAYRFTNVDGSNCRRPQHIETLPNPRRIDGLFTATDILGWLTTAATWNRGLPMAASRRIKPLGRHQLACVPHDWSRFFGFGAPSWSLPA